MNDNVDYAVAAELYPAPTRRKGPVGYRRFDTLAEAVRYAVESLPPVQLAGAFIETEENRYGAPDIRALYDAFDFPEKSQ